MSDQHLQFLCSLIDVVMNKSLFSCRLTRTCPNLRHFFKFQGCQEGVNWNTYFNTDCREVYVYMYLSISLTEQFSLEFAFIKKSCMNK